MDNQNLVLVEKKVSVWKIIKILLVVAAIAFVAVKVYQKFFKKNNEELDELDEADALALDMPEEVADDTFEVCANDVIANAEDMSAEA